MLFFGEYEVSFTAPGRIILPKKLREVIGGSTFVLTKGNAVCLAGYEKENWESKVKELLHVSLFDKTDLDRRRLVFSSASYIEIDDQGRFVIPKALLEYGALKGRIILAGVGDYFEIWDSRNWGDYIKSIKN